MSESGGRLAGRPWPWEPSGNGRLGQRLMRLLWSAPPFPGPQADVFHLAPGHLWFGISPPWSSVHLICFDHPSISGRSSFRLFLAAITLLLPPGVTVSPYWANKWFSFGQTSRCWGPPPWFGWLPFASRSHWNGRHRWLCTVWCWRRNSCFGLPGSQCRQSRIAEALLLHKEM